MRIIILLIMIMGMAVSQPGRSPQNSDYLRIEWLPVTQTLISSYTVARFDNSVDTVFSNALDSLVLNGSEQTVAYFSSLPHNTPFYFRVISENSLGRSPVSEASLGLISDNILPAATSTTGMATVSWSVQMPGATRGRVKYATSSQDLLNGTNFTNWTSVSGGNLVINLQNLNRGQRYYYFAVENDENGNSYASDMKTFITEPDIHEPNNSSGSATGMPENTVIDAYIFPENDLDYYEFQLADTTKKYELFVSNSTSFDLHIRILNFQSGELTNYTLGAGGTDNRDILNGQQAGTYYVVVSAVSNQADYLTGYTIQVREKGVDLFEDNDVAARATSINPGTTYQALIQDAGDVDYYRFSQEYKGQGSLIFSNTPLDLDIELLDVNQRVISSTHTTNGSANLNFIRYPQSSEILFLRVASLNSGQFDPLQRYTFRVETPPDPSTIDAFEPNDLLHNAIPIQVGNSVQSFTAFPNDSDYFSIDLSSYQSLQVGFSTTNSFEYVIRLLSGTANILSESSTTNGNGSLIRGLDSGNYYVFIRTQNADVFDTEHSYTLSIGTTQGDQAEPNNDFNEAWELTSGQQLITAFAYEEDIDYFRISSAVGASIRVQLDGINIPVKMSFFSASEDSLSEYRSADGAMDIRFAAETSTSYLRVERDTTYFDPDNYYIITATVMGGTTLVPKKYFDGPNPYNPNENTEPGFIFRSLLTNYRIEIYDVSGYSVRSIVNTSGSQKIWDGTDKHGKKMAPGVYHYLVFDNRNKLLEKGLLVLIQ